MLEFDRTVKSQRRLMLYLLSILILGAAFTSYQRLFWGLLLGTSVSFISLLLLQRQARALGEAVSGGKKTGSLGTLSRITLMLLVVFIAMKFEDLFNLYAVLVGLVTSYVVMLVDSIVHSIIEAKKHE